MLPSIPRCLCPRFLSLHLRLPHPFSFIRLPLSFFYILIPSFSQFRIFPSFSMHNSPSLHLAMFPVECLCVCCCAGCALSGSCALAVSPSVQQPLLLLNITGPLLLQLNTARVSAPCRKISWLFFETKTVEAGTSRETVTALLEFLIFCKSL